MTDTKKDRYYLDASAFFARHPHLDKQDPRFEYASDRREYVESLAASSPAPKAPPAAPASPSSPEAAADVWAYAFAQNCALAQKPAPAASSPAPKAPPAAPASPNEAIHPAWRWAMQRHGLTVF